MAKNTLCVFDPAARFKTIDIIKNPAAPPPRPIGSDLLSQPAASLLVGTWRELHGTR
eukprot:CAMPEP_0174889518 /NCGR_PEP_ID=MMETSP0167-20121228/4756_1 /TAXON_ID=38298 /ORGANISM="Rhodella maculata, Strain CCMP736" /LENGTH=56 /DNA_ID=CAMNT_0016126941 /DNA_START=483 /DNA_END=653 /DNA_ORIENTATION=-